LIAIHLPSDSLIRCTVSQVFPNVSNRFWGKGMAGTKASLKIVSSHRDDTPSGKADCATPADSPAPPKLKPLDQLREAMRTYHYSRRTEQSCMIYTPVLNRGPTGVRGPLEVL
jgi:hypothetical protein